MAISIGECSLEAIERQNAEDIYNDNPDIRPSIKYHTDFHRKYKLLTCNSFYVPLYSIFYYENRTRQF